jgi:hypothetical protein
MLTKYYYKLDLNFLSHADLLDSPRHQQDLTTRWLTDSVDTATYLHQDVANLFDKLGIKITSYLGDGTMSLFRGAPLGYLEPHIDRGTCWAINYVTGTEHSDMVWYKTVDNAVGYEIPTSNGKASYRAYHEQDLIELDRARLYGVYLVRIDLPHSIHNYDSTNHRWCFSLKDATNRWSWQDTVDKFKPYINE